MGKTVAPHANAVPVKQKQRASASGVPARQPTSVAAVGALQRAAGNSAVVQLLATSGQLRAEVGGPRQDVRLGKLTLRKMSTSYKRLIGEMDAYEQATDQTIDQSKYQRQGAAADLIRYLQAVEDSANNYVADHPANKRSPAKNPRVARILRLVNESAAERVTLLGIASDKRYDDASKTESWRTAIVRSVEVRRLQGQAKQAVDTATAGAASREEQDLIAARQRLMTELNVPEDEVDELVRKSLLVLASAPLTVNFSHKKLALILRSGGFKNYWQVTPALADPGPGGTAEEKQKYDYQQERLEAEHRLFGSPSDLGTKKANAADQAISTAANVLTYQLGGAPSMDYGRSVAVLKDRVKHRATYTPWDALVLMKRIRAGLNFVGPEVVATHEHLAAILVHTEPAALRDIVSKARNPNKAFDNAMPNYVEAQIHGPLVLDDIAEITINIDDLENEAWEEFSNQGVRRPSDQQMAQVVETSKAGLRGALAGAGIKVSFASL